MAGEQPDAYLTGRIERQLAEDPRTHELGVRAELRAGVVYLLGEVACAERRELVAQVAAEAAAGAEIRNEVTVTRLGPAGRAEGVP